MTAIVSKSYDGKKFIYTFNGEAVRTSARDFKYACIAISDKNKGASSDGIARVISLGNKIDTTYNSKANLFQHCNLVVVEIQ